MEYQNELVTRCAPRWAWDTIDETLTIDADSAKFDEKRRNQISAAQDAMIAASLEGAS